MKTTTSKKKIKTNGIVIKTININESNRLLVLLTDSLGVVTAFAGGVRKPSSKIAGGCGLFVYSNFVLTETGGKYRIDEAVPKELFYKIRYDISAFSLASYFCELLSVIIPEGASSSEYVPTLLNALYMISEAKKPLIHIKTVTEIRLIMLAGFMPDLDNNLCEHKTNFYFDYINGRIICGSCAAKKPNFKGHKLNQTLFEALQFMIKSEEKKAYNFSIPDKDMKSLNKITENYVIEQIEYKCKTLNTFKELI